MGRQLRRSIGACALAALALAACGDDESDARDEQGGPASPFEDGDPRADDQAADTGATGEGSGSVGMCEDDVEPVEWRVVVTAVEPASDDELADAAVVVCARVASLTDDLEVVVEDGTVVAQGPDAELSERAVALIENDAVVSFRPVLQSGPAEAPGFPAVTPPGDDAPDATVVLDDAAGTRYVLAPVSMASDVIETAEPDLESNGWLVSLTMRAGADGIDAFNAVAELCSDTAPECPLGQLAIVHDSTVVSAPTIQEPSFERDQIRISGEFDEAEARTLAAALRAGDMPIDVEARAVTPG